MLRLLLVTQPRLRITVIRTNIENFTPVSDSELLARESLSTFHIRMLALLRVPTRTTLLFVACHGVPKRQT